MIKEIAKSRNHVFKHYEYVKGIIIEPSTPLYVVYSNDGTELQSGNCTINSDKSIEFELDYLNNTTIGKDFKASFTFLVDGDTKTVNYLFDVVINPISFNLSDKNVLDYLPELSRVRNNKISVCSSNGTTTTIIDDTLSNNDFEWVGAIGSVKGKEVKITAYEQATGTLTFQPALSVATSTGDDYSIKLSYNAQLEKAFDYVLEIMRNKVGIASRFIDNRTFDRLATYYAIYLICIGLIDNEGDRYDLLSQRFLGMFDSNLASFNQAIDSDDDGSISDTEKEISIQFGEIGVRR